MHDGGDGLFAQDLKAHTVIGLVVTAELYGRKESGVVCSILYPMVAFVVTPEFCIVYRQTQHPPCKP